MCLARSKSSIILGFIPMALQMRKQAQRLGVVHQVSGNTGIES